MTSTTNGLSRASSSYLRSAMHQPIHWFEWGAEAFARAKQEDKPVLLDIGAVWCHWCHVMDRESYEDPAIADVINTHFIAIKVDRDERPDIDSRYQAAVNAVSGQGGWPLTAFLTPDGKPFYGGTYFPPSDGYGRPSFRRVLLSISAAYKEKNGDVVEQAQMVESAVGQAELYAGQAGECKAEVVEQIVAAAKKGYDATYGGFGHSPKFPHPAMLELLMEHGAREGDEEAREIAVETLRHMAAGGFYDQLAGGFHRYSVDERWIVPHFEKMSYDNSELLRAYANAYWLTGDPLFAGVARDMVRWMDEWLSDRERGGFYASQDADYSMDDDGDYFTWTLDEAASVLSREELDVAAMHYDIGDIGEMHHNAAKNVLFIRASVEEVAVRLKLSVAEVKQRLDSAKKKMYAARLLRPAPFVDKTVYTGWNALCISAYLLAGRAMGMEDCRAFALKSLDRVLSQAWDDEKGLQRVVAYSASDGDSKPVAGVLEDYAYLAVACLDAFEATSEARYFQLSRRIAEGMLKRFFDEENGGFFDTQPALSNLGALGARRKPFQDSPTPAGNSVAAGALLRLHGFTHEDWYRVKAERTLALAAGIASQMGIFAATYARALSRLVFPATQVAIFGSGSGASELYHAAWESFDPSRVVLRIFGRPDSLPGFLDEMAQGGNANPYDSDSDVRAVVCSGFTCQPPVRHGEELKRILEANKRAGSIAIKKAGS